MNFTDFDAMISKMRNTLSDFEHENMQQGLIPLRWLQGDLYKAAVTAIVLEIVRAEVFNWEKGPKSQTQNQMITELLEARRRAGQPSMSLTSYYRLARLWQSHGKISALIDGRSTNTGNPKNLTRANSRSA